MSNQQKFKPHLEQPIEFGTPSNVRYKISRSDYALAMFGTKSLVVTVHWTLRQDTVESPAWIIASKYDITRIRMEL